ncbi:protein vacuoleless1 [Tanacetum coccineum]
MCRCMIGTPMKMGDLGLEEFPLCMAVIEPKYTMSGNVEVLLGVGDHVLLVEEDGGVQIVGEGLGPLQKMVVSCNGKLLASFTHDGQLLVMPTDFSSIIFEYACETAIAPDQLVWCGMDSVLLYWDDMLLMVGPYGDPVRYIYDEPIILIPECDGARILSNSTFLQRVSQLQTGVHSSRIWEHRTISFVVDVKGTF